MKFNLTGKPFLKVSVMQSSYNMVLLKNVVKQKKSY